MEKFEKELKHINQILELNNYGIAEIDDKEKKITKSAQNEGMVLNILKELGGSGTVADILKQYLSKNADADIELMKRTFRQTTSNMKKAEKLVGKTIDAYGTNEYSLKNKSPN